MNINKSSIKKHSDFIVALFFLFIIFTFEYFVSPKFIPDYTHLQQYRIILVISGILVLILVLTFGKRTRLFHSLYLILFSISRMDEVLFILPKINSPNMFFSIFIFTNFLSVFILIFYSNFSLHKISAFLFFIFSIVFEFLYFQKLKDLPPIIEILILATTISTAVISRLLRMEQKKRTVIREMYNKEVLLKEKIALMKGRMLEQEKTFSLSMLTAGIAHELGNPINYLQGNLYFIKNYIESLINMTDRNSITDKEIETLEKIELDYKLIIDHSINGFNTITEIIENMKHIYGNRHNRKEKVDIKELLTRTIDFFKVSHKNDNYTIETSYNSDLFAFINPGEYYIVFSNIITNALESIDQNSTKGLIKIEAARTNGFINISITDNGSGIGTENITRIFDPFFSTKTVKYNLGLGLALSREIIESDNGIIKIISKKSEGTRVTISIREFTGNV